MMLEWTRVLFQHPHGNWWHSDLMKLHELCDVIFCQCHIHLDLVHHLPPFTGLQLGLQLGRAQSISHTRALLHIKCRLSGNPCNMLSLSIKWKWVLIKWFLWWNEISKRSGMINLAGLMQHYCCYIFWNKKAPYIIERYIANVLLSIEKWTLNVVWNEPWSQIVKISKIAMENLATDPLNLLYAVGSRLHHFHLQSEKA